MAYQPFSPALSDAAYKARQLSIGVPKNDCSHLPALYTWEGNSRKVVINARSCWPAQSPRPSKLLSLVSSSFRATPRRVSHGTLSWMEHFISVTQHSDLLRLGCVRSSTRPLPFLLLLLWKLLLVFLPHYCLQNFGARDGSGKGEREKKRGGGVTDKF